jgi:hypothetical protein
MVRPKAKVEFSAPVHLAFGEQHLDAFPAPELPVVAATFERSRKRFGTGHEDGVTITLLIEMGAYGLNATEASV